MGSGTHCSKIDGFPGTHGTHANGATVTVEVFSKPVIFKVSHQEFVFRNAFMALLVDLEAILETRDKD